MRGIEYRNKFITLHGYKTKEAFEINVDHIIQMSNCVDERGIEYIRLYLTSECYVNVREKIPNIKKMIYG